MDPNIILRGRDNFINEQWIWITKEHIQKGKGRGRFVNELENVEMAVIGNKLRYIKGYNS